MKTVYVSVGNTDNKLSQREWYGLHTEVALFVTVYAKRVLGKWYSEPTSPYVNACFAFEIDEGANEEKLRHFLEATALKYHQDAIVWAEATTEFIHPVAHDKDELIAELHT